MFPSVRSPSQRLIEPPYYLSSVAAFPQNDFVSENLANQSAVFTVNNNAATTAFFTNSTEFGYVKVCKTLQDSNSDALIGSTFTFDVNDAAGMQTESVTAVCAWSSSAMCIRLHRSAGGIRPRRLPRSGSRMWLSPE